MAFMGIIAVFIAVVMICLVIGTLLIIIGTILINKMKYKKSGTVLRILGYTILIPPMVIILIMVIRGIIAVIHSFIAG